MLIPDDEPSVGALQKRALLLAPYFLPRRRVGSMRPFRFAIHLKEFGWEPTIVTIAAPNQHLTRREATLLRDVNIVAIKSPIDRTTKSESQLGVSPRQSDSSSGGAASRLLQTVDEQFPVDTWLLLFMARYRQLVRVVRRVNPHVIWATADPWSSLVVGRRLARRFRLPFFPDFRDPWTLADLRTSAQWEASKAVDRYLEREVIRDADVVVFQTPLVEAMYRRHYDDVAFYSQTVPNSFDPTVFEDEIDFTAATRRGVSPGGGLQLAFFGRFRRMSPVTLAADMLNHLRRARPHDAHAVEVHSFGSLSLADEEYAADRNVLGSFKRREPVPLERSLSVLREYDILLLSTEASRKEIIPAKLFEYLAAGRPILSLTRNPEIERMLTETGTGVQIANPQEAARLLADCLRAKRAGEPMPIPFDPNPAEIMRYDARRTTRELAALFDSIVEPTTA